MSSPLLKRRRPASPATSPLCEAIHVSAADSSPAVMHVEGLGDWNIVQPCRQPKQIPPSKPVTLSATNKVTGSHFSGLKGITWEDVEGPMRGTINNINAGRGGTMKKNGSQRSNSANATKKPRRPVSGSKATRAAKGATSAVEVLIGGLIRNAQGEWLMGFQQRLSQRSILEAEINAIQVALQLTLQHNMTQDCQKLLLLQPFIQLRHVFRAVNNVAHTIVHVAAPEDTYLHVLYHPPVNLCVILQKDASVCKNLSVMIK